MYDPKVPEVVRDPELALKGDLWYVTGFRQSTSWESGVLLG